MSQTATSPQATHGIECRECGFTARHYLGDHLTEFHGWTADTYLSKFPGAATASETLAELFKNTNANPKRKAPPAVNTLSREIAGVDFPVFWDVPESACLPLPAHWRTPEKGELGVDVQHAAIACRCSNSLYVHGMPGCGKDAWPHALSNITRRPALMFSIQPGTDIEPWFFVRAFTQEGTLWEEGPLLKALRDGYETTSGRRVPYLILISDFDRADPSQAEFLRLITDSIKGRVVGPQGVNYNVFPGTLIYCTGNSAGSGDTRGRCISANPIDASLLDRFDVVLQFHWMAWEDEVEVVKAKFPLLVEKAPDVFPEMGKATEALREAIYNEALYAEFSHRALCSILAHAENLLRCSKTGKIKNLLQQAKRVWIDRLPDSVTVDKATALMDPYFTGGTIDAGSTSHIGKGGLADGWA